MDTKIISQWTLSNKEAQQKGLDGSFDNMVANLGEMIQAEIAAFINGQADDKDKPLF
nr:hypothetical protein [Pseudoalteromonas sp. WY3]